MINDNDASAAPFVAVVNETLAKKYFPGKAIRSRKQINLVEKTPE